MSNSGQGLTYNITADASGLTRGVNQANSAFAAMQGAVSANFFGVQALSRAMAAFPLAVAAGAAVAIRWASQWEDAIADVGRTTGLTGRALDDLAEELEQISRVRPGSPLDIAAIASNAGALGIAEQDIANFTEVVADLVATSDLGVDTASQGLARIAAATGLTGGEFDNLASAILRAGVDTAAAESEIVALATRLVPFAAIVGLSADETIAFSTALRSAGLRSELSATAFGKTVNDIAQSISEGGDEIHLFAQVAGESTEDFVQLFRTDAAQALLQFINGLGQVTAEGGDAIAVLRDLEIAETRQQQALLTLANFQVNSSNEQFKLNNILALTRQEFLLNAATGEQTARIYSTFSAQVGILRNQVFFLGETFGSALLPALTAATTFVAGLVKGFDALPAPLQTFLATVVVGGALLSALGAALLFVGSRLVQARQSLVGFVQSLVTAGTASQKFAVDTRAASSPLGALAIFAGNASRAMKQFAQAELEVTTNAQGAVVAVNRLNPAIVGTGFAATQAAGRLHQLRGALLSARAAALGLIGVLALVAVQAFQAGNAVTAGLRARERAEQDVRSAIAERVKAETVGNEVDRQGVIGATLATDAYREAADAARDFGVSQIDLNDIVFGRASADQIEDFVNTVADSGVAGNEEFANSVLGISTAFDDTASALVAADGSSRESADAFEELAGSLDEAGSSGEDLAITLGRIAQGHIDLIGALSGRRRATLALSEAEERLEQAQLVASQRSDIIRDAELEVVAARNNRSLAALEVAQAEADLARSQAESIDLVLDAEDDLASASDSYLDSLEDVRQLEEEVSELRRGTPIEELTEATNDLRDAQLSLVDAEFAVRDAEFQLSHLRNLGAGAYDIERAEHTLSKARQDAANAAEDITKAEEDLDELRDPEAQQRRLVEAERDLADARRDSESALRDIADAENALFDVRRDESASRTQIEANLALIDAHQGVIDSNQGLAESELELQQVREDRIDNDLLKAELDYEQALLGVAEAEVEVARQTAIANGLVFDAGDEARAYARALGDLDPQLQSITDRFQNYIDVLNRAPDVPLPAPSGGGGGGGGDIPSFDLPDLEDLAPDVSGISSPFAEQLRGAIEDGFESSEVGEQSFWNNLLLNVGPFAAAALIGPIGTALASSGVALGGAIALGIAGIGVALFRPDIVFDALEWVRQKIHDPIFNAIGDVFGDRAEEISRTILGAIFNLSQVANPLVLFSWISANILHPIVRTLSNPGPLFGNIADAHEDFIGFILTGLTNAANAVFNFVKFIDDNIIQPIGKAITDSVDSVEKFGEDVISGFLTGVEIGWEAVKSFFSGLIESIKDAITGAGGAAVDLYKALESEGEKIMSGIFNGVISVLDGFIKPLFRAFADTVKLAISPTSNFLGILYDVGIDIIQGLLNGMMFVWDKAGGVGGWLADRAGSIIRSIGNPLGIRSPSRVMMGIGDDVMEGLNLGMQNSFRNVEQTLRNSALSIASFDPAIQAGIDNLFATESLRSRSVGASGPGSVGGDTFNLTAMTNADPQQIVDEYFFQKSRRGRR